MCKYDDVTLEPIPNNLAPGEKEHVLIPQDECIVNVNDSTRCQWLKDGQQPLKKKGMGMQSTYVVGFVRPPAISSFQKNRSLPKLLSLRLSACRLPTHKIIYPGKNHDAWWDLKQLMEQMKYAVDIFEYLHPEKVGIWLFDCFSAHEGLIDDALNVNKMNVNPGGKQ
jgi:hypothetical protein